MSNVRPESPVVMLHSIGVRGWRRAVSVAVAFVLVWSVLGCASREPEEVSTLEVHSPCAYSVNGASVELAMLPEVLRASFAKNKTNRVRFVTSKNAKYECVSGAAAAAQQVGANIGLVGNVQP
jgi:biopolymer transport protein ExbD